MNVTVCNPLLRTPLSLIIDDSCPVINKAWFWIQQRHEWRMRHQPNSQPDGWERHYDKLGVMPRTVAADFAKRWGEWCGEHGVKGKFSFVPFPAGVGRVDRGFNDFPRSELTGWLRAAKEIIARNFDLTPEMITHTRVVDLKTWRLTDEWEQREWVDPPAEKLPDYIATAMRLLKNAGIRCEGVTSPGAFGSKKESLYASATLDAALNVNGLRRPFYFLHMDLKGLPDVPLWHADKQRGTAIASIIGCAGDWFGATGWDKADADLFITPDLKGGRLPAVLAAERPCVLVGHWPCFHANDGPGFKVLKEVKRRLDAFDPDGTRTLWMKNSRIGHYWMARKLSDIAVEQARGGAVARVRIATKFPTPDFTLACDAVASRVQVGCGNLREVRSRRDFRSGTFLVDGPRTFVAFDLPLGETTLTVSG